jgi:hypothetical protein
MTEDTELSDLLTGAMGIRFPFNARTQRGRSGGGPVMVYPAAIDNLSLVAVGLYCKLALRWDDNLTTSEQDAVDILSGNADQARQVLAELATAGCLLTHEVSDERAAAQDRLMWGDPRDQFAPRPKTVEVPESQRAVPDPWPRYTRRQWKGTVDSRRDSRDFAPWGTSVVYFLYDEAAALAYVGSSSDMWGRVQAHAKNKDWFYFWARECTDRESAYWLEAAEIIAHRPPLNQEYTLGGRPKHVPQGFRCSRCPKSIRNAVPESRAA